MIDDIGIIMDDIDPTMAYEIFKVKNVGRPGIPSNSILIFEIELLKILS